MKRVGKNGISHSTCHSHFWQFQSHCVIQLNPCLSLFLPVHKVVNLIFVGFGIPFCEKYFTGLYWFLFYWLLHHRKTHRPQPHARSHHPCYWWIKAIISHIADTLPTNILLTITMCSFDWNIYRHNSWQSGVTKFLTYYEKMI